MQISPITRVDTDLEALAKKQGLPDRAVFYLALARVAVLVLSFPRVARLLGRSAVETPVLSLENKEAALVVAWAVQSSAKSVVWRCECLEQALATKWLLKQRKISSTLYFGTFFNGVTLEAHAWVRAGNLIVVGERGYQQFTVIGIYGDQQ